MKRGGKTVCRSKKHQMKKLKIAYKISVVVEKKGEKSVFVVPAILLSKAVSVVVLARSKVYIVSFLVLRKTVYSIDLFFI